MKRTLLLIPLLLLTACGDTEEVPVETPAPEVVATLTTKPTPIPTEEPEVETWGSVEEWLADNNYNPNTFVGTIDTLLNNVKVYTYTKDTDGDERFVLNDYAINHVGDSYIYQDSTGAYDIAVENPDSVMTFFDKNIIDYLPSQYTILPESTKEKLLLDRDISSGYKYYYDTDGYLQMAKELPEGAAALDMTTHYTVECTPSGLIINATILDQSTTYLSHADNEDVAAIDTFGDYDADEAITNLASAYTSASTINFNKNVPSSCGCGASVDPDCDAGCCSVE